MGSGRRGPRCSLPGITSHTTPSIHLQKNTMDSLSQINQKLSHRYPEFRIPSLSWPEGLTWSQVPTPQWELSPATPILRSPRDGCFPLEYDCNPLPTENDYPTPEYDLQEKDDLRKSQINTPTAEAQQKRESRRRPILLSELFDDSESEAEHLDEIDLKIRKHQIDSSAAAVEILRQTHSETITPPAEFEHGRVQPSGVQSSEMTEVEHWSEMNLHSSSVDAADIIDTSDKDKNQIHTNQMKTDSHSHSARESNSFHVHHHNGSEIFPNQSWDNPKGDQISVALAHSPNEFECRDIGPEDREVEKEVEEVVNSIGEEVFKMKGVVDMEEVVDMKEVYEGEVAIEMDIVCQSELLSLSVDNEVAILDEKFSMINQEVVSIGHIYQSMSKDEVMTTFVRGSKSPLPMSFTPDTGVVGSCTALAESPKPAVLDHVMEDVGRDDESFNISHRNSINDLVLSCEPSEELLRNFEYTGDSIEHNSFYKSHESPGDGHSSHKPHKPPADGSSPSRKYYEGHADRSLYRDPTEARRSSRKHNKHSRESKSHNSHQDHHHGHHYRRHPDSRSPSKALKRSHRHHRSHKKDEDKRDGSRHEAKDRDRDRGRRSGRDREHRQGSSVNENYDNASSGHSRLYRPSSSSPVRQLTTTHQKNNPQNSPSELQEVSSRKKISKEKYSSRRRAKGRSTDRDHRSHHGQKHPLNGDSDTSPTEHIRRQSPSASLTCQTNIPSQREKVLTGVRQRLQEGYGDPQANLAAQGYFCQQGQLGLVSRYYGYENTNYNHGGFYGGYPARNNAFNRHLSEGIANDSSFGEGSNSLKWKRGYMA